MASRFIIATIEGKPIAKGRPRLGRNGVYTDAVTKAAETAIGWELKKACAEPLSGTIEVSLYFTFRAPKSWRKADRERAEEEEEAHVVKPDLDNLIKLALDAANGILWRDDALVASIEAHKCYGETEATTFNVEAHP